MRGRMQWMVPVAVAAVLIVTVSIVQAFLTDRWSDAPSDDARALAAAYAKVPLFIGDWEGQDLPEVSQREREAAGAVGLISRSYRNHGTGERVSVYLVCGAARAVAVHTPDACYPGSGFRVEEEPREYPVPGNQRGGDFFTAVFLKEDPSGSQRLRLFWLWRGADPEAQWEAPELPRMRFGGRQAINKLYLIAHCPSGQAVEESPALSFADVFLPALEKALAAR